SFSKLKWIRTNQENISRTDPLKGPGRDHSNSASHFLYVTVPDSGLTMDWASFQSPPLQPTNSSHPCKMVMYTHQFGPRSGGLTVLVAQRLLYPAWERGGALGDLWAKAEVEIVSNSTFQQILIMAAIRDFAYGGIGVDSIVLSPECRRSSNNTLETIPKPPKDPCIDDPEKMCDFNADCAEAEDEAKCDFSYVEGSSGWTDASVGSQGWVLHKNATAKEYLYVAEASGQQLTEAQTRTPLLGPTGPVCSLSFDFALTGSLDHIELSLRVIDSLLGPSPKLWEFSGKTGAEEKEESWQQANILIGHRKHRFQLAFEAWAVKTQPYAWIKVRNVHFINCHTDYYPATPTLSCNFEEGLCSWYQDNSDNFDWSLVTGMDHTSSLVVDMWSPSLLGASGRLVSFLQPPAPTEMCLTFFYKLYGPDALMFEAVRSGFDGQVAIDDVTFLDGLCAMPRKCSFEAQMCGYSSYGTVKWLHRNGHSSTASGPKLDHTLGTELYYMMVNTDRDVLPASSTAVLVSPVRSGTTKTECVTFWYHMKEENPYLRVYMKPEKGERVQIFSANLNQGDEWRHGQGNISSGLVDWQSMENGMCIWNNIQDSERDKLDWDLTSRETEEHYPVPPEDHTLGTEKHFLFFPSSNRTAANQNAWILSPHLPATQATCLRFWAYKDCQLRIWRLSGGLTNELLRVTELGGPWKLFEVNITSAEEYQQIVFEGIKGTAGFVALDDIEYTVGFDCATRVTKP
uniref:Apical endosomal glycoprotein-like n=1 Tax=Cyprinodon variegatus TaxID=28743 RepID=A0A3Q2FGI9_CYPVA